MKCLVPLPEWRRMFASSFIILLLARKLRRNNKRLKMFCPVRWAVIASTCIQGRWVCRGFIRTALTAAAGCLRISAQAAAAPSGAVLYHA